MTARAEIADEIADHLTQPRINWTAIIGLGGDLIQIAREARAAGDEEGYRRATRAAHRRGIYRERR